MVRCKNFCVFRKDGGGGGLSRRQRLEKNLRHQIRLLIGSVLCWRKANIVRLRAALGRSLFKSKDVIPSLGLS